MRCDLSKTEMEIMQVLWDCDGFMIPSDILKLFNSRGKNWKRQTLNTLLKRMEEKEVVARRRGSVQTLCSELEYRHQQSREVVNEYFDGRLDLFVAAYAGKRSISRELSGELEELIDRLMRDEGDA